MEPQPNLVPLPEPEIVLQLLPPRSQPTSSPVTFPIELVSVSLNNLIYFSIYVGQCCNGSNVSTRRE